MLPGAADKHRPDLYRWKRTSKKPGTKAAFDYDNVEHWIKRVEQASEFAVSEVFAPKKSTCGSQRSRHLALNLESTHQLHDHDEAYSEAQDLLSEWLSNKLTLQLASDNDSDPEDDAAKPTPAAAPDFTKYSRFDDLYQHLERGSEDSDAQLFLQQLLQKEVVDSGILESLAHEQSGTKRRDPGVTMDVRHQQVKEKRLRRQQEAEKKRQEAAMKKAALVQAQRSVQEENRQKALRAKREEEEIQRQVVRLRREVQERRRAAEEERQRERKRQELEKTPERPQTPRDSPDPERKRQQKQARIQEMLSRVYAQNHRCLQVHFSRWYRLVLERRVRMGKARALADWRHQQRTFRAWRHHTWMKRVERESREMETELREQNRKQQAAAECYQKRLLRRCLIEWQLFCRAEKEKRDLEARKEETKRKMAALLDAASSLGNRTASAEVQAEGNSGGGGTAEREEETGSGGCKTPVTPSGSPSVPRHAWQVTRQHAALTPIELQQLRTQPSSAPRRSAPPTGETFHNRHQFQKKTIEEQRRQLEEQKQMILGLMENQRLMMCRQEAERATAATAQLTGPVLTRGTGSEESTRDPAPRKQETSLRLPSSSEHLYTSPAPSTVSTDRKNPGPSTPHPAVTAMEERAAQRMERKRLLEETRRRREEEKLDQLRAAERQRQEAEAAEKQKQLERKREEKRLQRQKEAQKQLRQQRERELDDRATQHNHRRLLRVWGLAPWVKALAQSRHNMERASAHHSAALLRSSFMSWSQAARESAAEKNQRAERLAAILILRRTFRQWIKYKDYLSIQEERAERRYRTNLCRKTFMAWLDRAAEERRAMWENQKLAAEHDHRRILLAALRTWRQFPQVMREQRLREERREMLRKRVAEILPDFRRDSAARPTGFP